MRRILILISCFLLAVGGIGHWLIFTPAGARWMLARIPGLEIASVQGSLAGNLELRGLRWSKGAERLSVDRLEIDWSPAALWHAEVLVRALRMSGAEVHLASTPEPALAPDLLFPRLPPWSRLLHVQIEHLDLAKLTSWRGRQRQLNLRQVEADVTWTGTHLRSAHCRIVSSAWVAEGSLNLGWVRPSLKSIGTWVSSGTRIAWSADWKAGAGAPLGGPVVVRAQGGVSFAIAADARLEQRAFQLRNGRLLVPGLSRPALLNAVLAHGHRSGRYHLHLRGDEIYLRGLRKPVPAGPYALDLQLDGTLQNYLGHMMLEAPEIRTRLAADLAGNEAGYRITALSGDMLGGRASSGWMTLTWRPALRIAAQLTLAGVNPESLLPHLQGSLNGALRLRLMKNDGGLDGALAVNLVSGRVDHQMLQGRARFSFAPRVFQVDALDITGPGLDVRAAGDLQRRLDFSAWVSQWANIFPALRGESRVAGWLAYANGRWRGRIQGRAQHLRFRAYQAATVHLTATSTSGVRGRLDIQARGMRVAGVDIDLDVLSQGTPSNFGSRIEARWQGNVVRLAARISHHANAWNAELQRLNVEGRRVGRWSLTEPVRIAWNRGRVAVPMLGLVDGRGASIRLAGDWAFAERRGQGSIHIRALPLRVIAVSGEVQAKGRVDLDAAARCDGSCTAVGDAGLSDATFAWRQAGRVFQIPVSSWTAGLRASPKAITVDTRLILAKGLGAADGVVILPVALNVPFSWLPAGPVRGRLNFDLRSHVLAAAPFHRVTVGPGWQIGGNLRLTGTWTHPEWGGNVVLRNATIFIPQAGISVTGIHAHLQARGDNLIISRFQADSGKGSIRGQGIVKLSGFTPSQYNLQLTGNDFSILNLPEVTASVAPNIIIDGDRQRVRITGKVTADRLRILGSQLGGVRPSGDVVFVKAPVEPGIGPVFDVRLVLGLGNDAKVILGGLQSGLQGTLQIMAQAKQPPRLEGVLNMVNGSYEIYGKSLKFTRGVIRFNGAAGQGILDVLALRRIPATDFGANLENVQVGVQVTGTLQSPQVQLYSVPAMSDTDVLSYLVFGYPASGLQSQNTLLAAAASQLFSTTQATLFRQSLLGDVGLGNLSASSAGAGAGTGAGTSGLAGTIITLGHYLTPYLYVSIGRSIVGTGTVARLRYRLTRSIEVQTEGGTVGSGVSVFYRIELR